MKLTNITIGERLKTARKNVGLNQDEAAQKVDLDRTALVKIEKGTRNVSGVELQKLAKLYRRDPAEFLTEEPLNDNPFIVFGRIYENQAPGHNQYNQVIELLKEAKRLSDCLGDQIQVTPRHYVLPTPTSYGQAVEQGKEVATFERQRLKIGDGPISNIANLIAAQGIWTAAVQFSDDISGLFVAHPKYGLTVFVNQKHKRNRRRFSYAHEYAHALIDRARKEPEPTSNKNRNDFVERRANAFASEFLLPATGVLKYLERIQKGGPTRSVSMIWDAAADEAVEQVIRHDNKAQKISLSDVAMLAFEYQVSYDVAAIRLKDINVIKEKDLRSLLEQRAKGLQLLKALKLTGNYEIEEHDEDQPYLNRQLILLALEAFRRGKISQGRFRETCDLIDVEHEELMPVAMAGVEG